MLQCRYQEFLFKYIKELEDEIVLFSIITLRSWTVAWSPCVCIVLAGLPSHNLWWPILLYICEYYSTNCLLPASPPSLVNAEPSREFEFFIHINARKCRTMQVNGRASLKSSLLARSRDSSHLLLGLKTGGKTRDTIYSDTKKHFD